MQIFIYRDYLLNISSYTYILKSNIKYHGDSLRQTTNLFLKRHHQDAPHLEQVLHIILMLFLHAGPAVHPVILTALWRDLQAVSHHKGWLTELKSEVREQQCTTSHGGD